MRKFFAFLCLFFSLFLFSFPFLNSCSQRVDASSIKTYIPTSTGGYDVVVLDPDILPFTSFRDNQRSAASLFSVAEFGFPVLDYVADSFTIPLNISYMNFLVENNLISFDNASLPLSLDLSVTVPFGDSFTSWTNSRPFYPYFQTGSSSPLGWEFGRLYFGSYSTLTTGHSYSIYDDWAVKITSYYSISEFSEEFNISVDLFPDVSLYSDYFDSDTAIGYYLLAYVIPCRDLTLNGSTYFPDIDEYAPDDFFVFWVASPCLIDFLPTVLNRDYASIPSLLANRFKSIYGGYGNQNLSISTYPTFSYNREYFKDSVNYWTNVYYDLGYGSGLSTGLNSSLGDVTPFDTVVYGVNSFLNLELFPGVKIGWILSFGFGLILLGLAISLFRHG